MTNTEINTLLSSQQSFFATGATLDVQFRINSLKKLRKIIKAYEADIRQALKTDLGKSAQESYMCEIGLTLSEISYMLSHVRQFDTNVPKVRQISTGHTDFLLLLPTQ